MVQLTSLILPSIFTLAFSAKAAFTGPSGNGTFSLIALAYDGDLHLSGLFPVGTHGGAGINVMQAVPTADIGGLLFNTTSGDIYLPVTPASSGDYTLSFDNYDGWFIVPNGVPANYGFMNMNVFGDNIDGANTGAGFEFNETTNMLLESSYKGKVMSICPWETISGLAYGLMFRNKTLTAGEKKGKGCADVRLKALFVDY